MPIDQQSGVDVLVRKAVNLFTFLGRTQELLVKPIRTVAGFEKAIWFNDVPTHPAVRSRASMADLNAQEPLLEVDRVPRLDPPALPESLIEWVKGPLDNTDKQPTLREEIFTDTPERWRPEPSPEDELPDEARDPRHVLLTEAVGISEPFDAWLIDWYAWATRERDDLVARDLYKELFALFLKSTDHSEEFELVVGVGCLTWRPEDHEQVQRHVATAEIAISFDEATGTLSITQVPSPQFLVLETDMLDPRLISSPAAIDEIRGDFAEYSGHVLDAAAVGELSRRLVFRLDPDATYDDVLTPPTGIEPKGAFAPAMILRRRTNRGLVQIYEQIVKQILETNQVPSGVLPLIDPDRQPETHTSSGPGAVVTIDEEDFLPLPVNEQQRRIIDRVDKTAQTVVQGPPGTGKTHTAAALVSNLLAQGKRVLITAHTDRALREVRAKLPLEIRALAVSVIGQSRSDMAELRTAVDSISRRADEFEPDESRKAIEQHHQRLDALRRERARTYARLMTVRRLEVETRTDGPEEGTLASIAYRNLQDEPRFEWIRDYEVDPHGLGTTVSTAEINRWRAILLDRNVIEREAEAINQLPPLHLVPTSDTFTAMVLREQQAVSAKEQFGALLAHESFDFVRSLHPALRQELQQRVSVLAERAAALEQRHETWMNEALRDVRSGRQQTWIKRSHHIKSLATGASGIIERLGPMTTITASGDLSVQQQIAKTLLAHLESGGKIKVQADGTPKLGAFTSKAVKQSDGFFRDIKVNGVPATTAPQLYAVIEWVEASRMIAAMDQAWPVSVEIPQEDTFGEQVQWHWTEVEQLDKVLALGQQIELERAWFQQNSLPVPNWNELEEIRRYATLVEAAAASDAAAMASLPIEQLAESITEGRPRPNLVAITAELVRAVSERDLKGFNAARGYLEHLHRVAGTVAERNRIHAGLIGSAPRIAEAIHEDPAAIEWDERLATYAEAWHWQQTSRWILAQDDEDVNALKLRLNDIDSRIRSEVEKLAAERAWGHAVAPGRLTGRARANLTQYAQLVSALGKGTGKYAAKQRAEITEAMDRCRPSVPVWIMPIYRIAEQVRVEPNLYDVVIVDEASQAGLEATFLQYLAPKIVVIGDDKQVSPSAVGVDQQQLHDLANQFLATDTFRASWMNPKRSYFDEASMRFGGKITLVEHRRCVPEIIGFSNRVAYEPEGIRLVPVRQFGAERLEPIRVVHLPNGYEAGNKTNVVEAEAIVDQIRKCIAEPLYDDKTMGVISLLGAEQARLIEGLLLDAVPPEEMTVRELRCGDASAFQGSERDIMFLSMVKAPSEESRLTALTGTQFVQRYNVAASRAKDQMWVYHSIAREDLKNPECMRYQLLDYCYGVANRPRKDAEGVALGVVPEDQRVAPFDSLFEQRVYNRIVDRGYTVHAQYPAQGYKIDMVIIGAKGKLAVECDGDFWHGPDVYQADLARQRELERCGWEFFRIRESRFYADMATSLGKLWTTLDELDIRTADWIDPSFDEDEDAEGVDEPLDNEETADVDVDTATPGEVPQVADVALAAINLDLPTDQAASIVEVEIETAPVERILVPDAGDLQSYIAFDSDDKEFGDVSSAPDDSASPLNGDTVAAEKVAEAVGAEVSSVEHEVPGRDDESAYREKAVVEHISVPDAHDLQPYIAFGEQLPSIADSRLDTVSTNMARIVAVEGPVLGERLHQAYAKAAGNQVVGKKIAQTFNQAITSAERRGMIISDNPLGDAGVKPKTFRLAAQPEVVARELGPRSLNLVPPAELAHHFTELHGEFRGRSVEELFRAVLHRLGLERLTDNAKAALTRAMMLVPLQDSGTGHVGVHLVEGNP